MRCTICGGEDTTVIRTHKDRRRIVRRRQCSADKRHVFDTEERPLGLPLEQVLVRRSGDNRLAEGGFDLPRLIRDVEHAVLKRLTDEEVRVIVERAKSDLELRLTELAHELSAQEKLQRPGYKLAITDVDIREAIERRLRRHAKSRMPHVLYALSTLGRSDREGRTGFTNARDVLDWMNEEGNYPDLNIRDLPPPKAVPTDTWWPPAEHTPTLEWVIKRDRTVRRRFGYNQFRSSIRQAMIGRPDADETSGLVASWVLWGLAGQRDVLSAQLAVGVMDCLRRVDDIAFLRWTAISKNIESVSDFRREALTLIESPSPRLCFTVEGQPRPRPSTRPG